MTQGARRAPLRSGRAPVGAPVETTTLLYSQAKEVATVPATTAKEQMFEIIGILRGRSGRPGSRGNGS
jgi:hypothetical protein